MTVTCYLPLKGWVSKKRNPSGKHGITFQRSEAYLDRPQSIPCGQCIGCRLEKARQWAVRCHHEASLHLSNSFITLTYSDEHLPIDMSIDVRTWQLFMKRLRKNNPGKKIRFYMCGEYGENSTQRPHYHAILFGKDFPDQKLFKTSKGKPIYRSAELETLWPYGHSYIGSVTYESAGYVARYITKKQTGDEAEDHYKYQCPVTGKTYQRKPPFTTMSRRPGIGYEWYKKYKNDVYPADNIVINGKIGLPPKYYDLLLEHENPKLWKEIQAKRQITMNNQTDNSDRRLKVKETVKRAQIKSLTRELE